MDTKLSQALGHMQFARAGFAVIANHTTDEKIKQFAMQNATELREAIAALTREAQRHV